MNDPLSDPRAQDLLSAVPDEVGVLAADFRTAATESHRTAGGLSAARDDGVWTGRAADAFRRAIGRLPAELDKVRAGFSAVADALTTYEAELARIKNAFVQVVADLIDAERRLAPARTAASSAAAMLRTTAHSEVAKRPALTAAELAVARADGAVGSLWTDIQRLQRRALDLLDEFSRARDSCRATIATARATAPVRPRNQGTTVIDVSGTLTRPGRSETHRPTRPASHGAPGHVPAGRVREKVTAMVKTAESLLGKPYVWGGGHGGWGTTYGLDCSGFVSAVLHSGGFLSSPETTEGFAGQAGLAAGHGHFVTIYDRTGCGANEHVIIDLNGTFYEEGGGSASGGATYVHKFTPSASYLASFNTVLHPVGL